MMPTAAAGNPASRALRPAARRVATRPFTVDPGAARAWILASLASLGVVIAGLLWAGVHYEVEATCRLTEGLAFHWP